MKISELGINWPIAYEKCLYAFKMKEAAAIANYYKPAKVYKYPDITVHLTLFNATIAEGFPQKIEHNDIKWITPNEIPQFNFCPADEEILRKIIEVYG